MFISILIATYNRAQLLDASISSLTKLETNNKFVFEIIVVDNGSTDNTKAIVNQLSQTVDIPIKYYFEKKPGVAFARNRGVKESCGNWIAFFDDDQIADQNWLLKLVEVAQAYSISCVGGQIKLSFPQKRGSLREVCSAILGSLDFGNQPIQLSKKCLPGTGSVLIKKQLFDIVGVFDESFTRGCEDADLFRRIKKTGCELWYAPESIAFHVIPEYRLQKEYFIWCSYRDGVNYAYLDNKEGGLSAVIRVCVLRLCQAFFIIVPKLLIAGFKKQKDALVDQKCLFSRAKGYLRQSLFLISPKLFSQEKFFQWLDFRGEHETFNKNLNIK